MSEAGFVLLIFFFTLVSELANPRQTETTVGASRSPEKCAQQRHRRLNGAAQRSSSLPPSNRKPSTPSKSKRHPSGLGYLEPHTRSHSPSPLHSPLLRRHSEYRSLNMTFSKNNRSDCTNARTEKMLSLLREIVANYLQLITTAQFLRELINTN